SGGYAQSKSKRNQRRGVAIARRKIRRVVQGNFGSARPRPQLAGFGEAAPVRLGMESSASREMQFPLPRAFGTMGALFGHFRHRKRPSQRWHNRSDTRRRFYFRA